MTTWHRTAAVPLAALLLTLCACTIPTPDGDTGAQNASPSEASPGSNVFPSPQFPSTAPPADGGSDFTAWSASLPGSVAMAVAAVGGGEPRTLAPEVTPSVAWSTVKVPLALAASRADGNSVAGNIDLALSESDNAAAEALWSSLGAPSIAAGAVEAVLRDGEDAHTNVQMKRVRPGFTAFGQTVWSVTDQSRWLAALPCMPDSDVVLEPMREVIAQQSWGFGTTPNTPIKGGWGPDPSGSYLVRQMALVETPTGRVAIAVTARPDGGTLASGIDLIDQVATWAREHTDALPSGRCP